LTREERAGDAEGYLTSSVMDVERDAIHTEQTSSAPPGEKEEAQVEFDVDNIEFESKEDRIKRIIMLKKDLLRQQKKAKALQDSLGHDTR